MLALVLVDLRVAELDVTLDDVLSAIPPLLVSLAGSARSRSIVVTS